LATRRDFDSARAQNGGHDVSLIRVKLNNIYDDAFFEGQETESLRSARSVVRHVMTLFTPSSVVDVGCGRGAWLSVFSEAGVRTLCGIDGSYVDRSKLRISPDSFISRDLMKPFDIPERFDLAMSVEVAEHLSEANGKNLIRALTRAAPIVLFSAAIPGQGGSGHINEQWPSYWRSLFADEGYLMFDPLRPLIHYDSSVRWWYRQNLVVFASAEAIASHRSLGPEIPPGDELQWVHISIARPRRDLRGILRELPGTMAVWSRVKPLVRSYCK